MLFWMVPHFCVNLMYMCDTMHQIGLGVIISFFKAILLKYFECIKTVLLIPGKAAKKLTTRLQLALKKYNCKSGQKCQENIAACFLLHMVYPRFLTSFQQQKGLPVIIEPQTTDAYFCCCHSYSKIYSLIIQIIDLPRPT